MFIESGLPKTVVKRILGGKQKIQRITEARVFAIPMPDFCHPTRSIYVPAIGTRRRLQALMAFGWSTAAIGRELGVTQSMVSSIGQREFISGKSAATVAAVFDRLQMTPGPSVKARQMAACKGWVPPFAWDEDAIDNPAASPLTGGRKVKFDEKYTELCDLGFSQQEIAARMGISEKSLIRQVHRHANRLDIKDAPPVHACPVCWAEVEPTIQQLIPKHLDSMESNCPGSEQPFRIAITEPAMRESA